MTKEKLDEHNIVYEVVKELGVIAEYSTGWKKEVNLVSWNSNTPKIDIRDWNPDHQHMTGGVLMSKEEAKKLYEILKNYFESTERK